MSESAVAQHPTHPTGTALRQAGHADAATMSPLVEVKNGERVTIVEETFDGRFAQVALASGESRRTLSVLWLTHSEAMPVATQCEHALEWVREMPWLVIGTDFYDGSFVQCNFSSAASRQAVTAGPAGGAVIRPEEHGAVADGVADDTAAIEASLRECASRGGCTLLFSSGRSYRTGPIYLVSNIHVEVEEGEVEEQHEDEGKKRLDNAFANAEKKETKAAKDEKEDFKELKKFEDDFILNSTFNIIFSAQLVVLLSCLINIFHAPQDPNTSDKISY